MQGGGVGVDVSDNMEDEEGRKEDVVTDREAETSRPPL